MANHGRRRGSGSAAGFGWCAGGGARKGQRWNQGTTRLLYTTYSFCEPGSFRGTVKVCWSLENPVTKRWSGIVKSCANKRRLSPDYTHDDTMLTVG